MWLCASTFYQDSLFTVSITRDFACSTYCKWLQGTPAFRAGFTALRIHSIIDTANQLSLSLPHTHTHHLTRMTPLILYPFLSTFMTSIFLYRDGCTNLNQAARCYKESSSTSQRLRYFFLSPSDLQGFGIRAYQVGITDDGVLQFHPCFFLPHPGRVLQKYPIDTSQISVDDCPKLNNRPDFERRPYKQSKRRRPFHSCKGVL